MSAPAAAKTLSQIENTLNANRVYAYRSKIGKIQPTWYQEALHQGGSTKIGSGAMGLGRVAKERWAFLPNQVGKSLAGAADDVMQAMGIHPYIEQPLPNKGLVLCVSHYKSVQVMRPLIYDFLPDFIKDHPETRFYNQNSEKPARLILPPPYGSEIYFMSADQDAMEFESLTLHWAHCDEEPAESIYNQLHIRLLRHRGNLLATMTPWIEEGQGGISWTADRILKNYDLPEEERSSEIWIAPYITMFDAPWLDDKAIKEFKKGCKSKEEYNARFRGIHMQRSGVVFDMFKHRRFSPTEPAKSGHLLAKDFPVNPKWNRVLLVDPSSPAGTTACLWMAVTTPGPWQGINFKGDELVIYREYKEQDRTVSQHAATILAMTGSETMDQKLMDKRFMKQSADADTGQTYQSMYQDHGLWCEGWEATSVAEEIDAMKEYLQGVLDRASKSPGIFIREDLRQTIWEIEHYIWPMHRAGDMKGERKPVPRQKSKKIHLLDCMKAACNLGLQSFQRHWETQHDYSKYQDSKTGF